MLICPAIPLLLLCPASVTGPAAPAPTREPTKIVLQIGTDELGSTSEILDLDQIQQDLHILFARKSVFVFSPETAEQDPKSIFLKITPLAVKYPDGVCCFHVDGRISLYSDRNLQRNPMGGGRVLWRGAHTGALASTAGLQNQVRQAVLDMATQLLESMETHQAPVHEERSLPISQDLPDNDRIQNAQPVDFAQLKVKVSAPAPACPPQAQKAGVQGEVLTEVTLDATGTPVQAIALRGPLPLRFTALHSVMQGRYEPVKFGNVPAFVRFNQGVSFHLSEPGKAPAAK